MLQYIYIILSVAVLLVWFKKRNISFLLVYFLSSILYYYNVFTGEIFIGRLNEIGVSSYPIANASYFVLIINMIVVFFSSMINQGTEYYIEKKAHINEDKIFKAFILILLVFSVYMVIRYDLLFRNTYNKTELSEEAGSLASYFKYLAVYAFVLIWTQEGKKYHAVWKISATIPALVTFLFGNRSFLVIGILGVVFDKVYKSCAGRQQDLLSYCIHHKKILIGGMLFVVIVLVAKGVTGALFVGNWELIKSRLTNPDYYKQVFFVSEPNTIMRNLDTIVSNEYQVDTSSYLTLWAYFFPFITGEINKIFGVKNFTYAYQKELFGTTNRACTYLGEAYANGGYVVVAIVVSLSIISLLLLFQAYKKCRSNISKCTLLLIGIDTAFYMQRNSMSYQFSRIRDYIYIAIILFVIIGISSKNHKIFL